MKVKISQATRMLETYLTNKLVPMVTGSPGIGKSQIIHSLANKYNLKVIDIRLAQCDPTDLIGLPVFNNNRTDYAPMAEFPLEDDPIPSGYDGWLMFLDEFNSSPLSVQKAAYKLVLDRMVGRHKLHPKVAIVAAGNLESDNAIVETMSTAMQSRLVHMELIVDHKEWLNWAAENGINHKITSYINARPGNLHTFDPDHSDKTYAAPRTWEFASRIMNTVDHNSDDLLPLLTGTLGEGVAREFTAYCRIYEDLPTIDDIIKKPTEVQVPQEPGSIYAITGIIAHNMNEKNANDLMEYVLRLPAEFQVVCMREAVKRTDGLIDHEAVNHWAITNANKFFD